jgi:hypothetical protein
MSRIYGGIHWSFDNTDGLKCGREIAVYVGEHSFGPRAAVTGREVRAEFGVRRRDR